MSNPMPPGPSPRRRWIVRSLCTSVMAGALVLAAAIPIRSDPEHCPPYNKQEIRRAIALYAKRYQLDPALMRAVIKVESDFRPHVVSKKGAVGLMQLTPETAATWRIADLHDPVQNIRGGARQLRHLLTLYGGDLPLALAAYNAGVHRVKEDSSRGSGKPGPMSETRSGITTPFALSKEVTAERWPCERGRLRVSLHDQGAKALALRQSDTGKFEPEGLALYPANDGLFDP